MFKKKIKRKLVAHAKIAQPYMLWVIFSSSVVAGAIVSITEPLDLMPLVIGAFIFSVFGQCGVRYLNDFGDQDVDRLNEEDPLSHTRMIVQGEIHPYEALGLGIILHVSGIILLYFLLNWFFALMFGIMVILSFMYSVYPRLKRLPFTPNIMIGIAYDFLPLVAGYSIYASDLIPPIELWILTFLCGVFGFGASIGKDFIDRGRDEKNNIRTLPVVLGEKLAARVQSAFFLIPYLAVGLLTLLGFFHPIMLWSFITLIPIGILVYKLVTMNFARERVLQWSVMLTLFIKFSFMILYRFSLA